MGLGALTAAEGLRKIGQAIRDFADSAQALTFLSRQTGLSINQLRVWQEEASRLGTSAGSLTQGFVGFSEQMQKLRRLGPTLGVMTELRQLLQGTGVRPSEALRQLVQSLQGLTREQQLEKVLKFLDHIQDMGQRRALAKAFGLDPAIVNKDSKQVLKDYQDIHKRIGDLTEDQIKKGQKAEDAFNDLADAVHHLSEEVGAELAPAMTAATTAIAEFIGKHGADFREVIKDIVDRLSGFDWRGFAADMRTTATTADAVAKGFGGWKNVIEGLMALKFAGWIFGILIRCV